MNSAQVVTWLSVGAMVVGSLSPVTQTVVKAITTQTQPTDFTEAVKQTAQRLNTQPEYLLAVMSFETGGTLDPCQKGAIALDGTRATGLIQFMPDTAKELGITSEELCRMSQAEQMAYVERYLVQRGFSGGGIKNLYSTVFAGHPNANPAISDGYHSLSGAVRRIEREHLPRAKAMVKSAIAD